MIRLIKTVVVQFYCLTIWDSVLLLLACAFLFCWLDENVKHFKLRHFLVIFLLIALSGAILYTTVGNREGNHTQLPNLVPFHSYRAVRDGANPELYRSNFMNAALFYPVGLLGTSLLPKKWAWWCRCLLVTALLCAMSAGIEYLQYRYALGLCEIDDVIHNTAGALIGSLAAVLIPKLLCWLRKKELL